VVTNTPVNEATRSSFEEACVEVIVAGEVQT
jgi:hypothetical protein